MKQKKLLITTALPYANGSIHLGHLVENIQADIWTRFQRMLGHDCLFLSGSDCHGTPVMLLAEKKGLDPETLVANYHQEHQQDLRDFLIEHDNFYSTHSPENRALCDDIYNKIKARGDIIKHTISQAFDEEKNIFLPDRFVKGDCPRCGASGQHGDNCEACGATYNPVDLKNPVSVLSGTTPVQKESEHYFFRLQNYEDALKTWMQAGHLQTQVAKKLSEWFDAGLREWNISRDAPYFGFEIPGAPNKYFYVWLDAPIGYMASLKNFCDKHPNYQFDDYWAKDSKAELYHFIGKDIVYFHALFWPAVLMSANLRTPNAIFVNGFLTINGEKLSKSRGTFINARTYLNHLNPEFLRYYLAAKLNGRIEDIDLNFDDFTARINADLIGKVVNIASRTAGFVTKKFNATLSDQVCDTELWHTFINTSDDIQAAYQARDYNRAIRQIMQLADKANQYIAEKAPWKLAKEEGKENEVHDICSLAINLFRVLIVYLKPILPKTAENVESFLNCDPFTWQDAQTPLLNHHINTFKPLLQRIDKAAIDAMQIDINAAAQTA